jgi:predicted amidohydrolase YtcJ
MRDLIALLPLLVLMTVACAGRPDPADLILRAGKIVTVDAERPEATALAARGGRIVAVGSDAQIDRFRGPATEVIDLGGRLAIPGFIDSHAHYLGLGQSLMNVDLRDARTWDEVVERVGRATRDAQPGEWILGRGWHQEKWAAPPEPSVEGYPTHHALTRIAPDHPVVLTHASGHAAIVNARAMAASGITRDTPDPPGGTILRDASGAPTGLLRETAEDLVGRAHAAYLDGLPDERVEGQRRRAAELAARECLSKGVTTFQDAGSDFATVDLLRRLAEEGRPGPRLWMMLNEDNDALERAAATYRQVGAAGGRFTVRAVKRVLDGALGSHGAWLLEPYADLPGTSGLNTYPLAELERTARIAAARDLQLAVHAIGDRANRETLDVFERVLSELPDGRERRWRIEHAQHLAAPDIPRFAELGVIASMQGVHCTSDGPWVPDRIGPDRARDGAYVWRSLLDAGVRIANGTDAPVEDVDPIASFAASVTRRLADGAAFHPEQRMTRLEALRSYTLDAAYAAFEDARLGSLSPGKLADVVVLSHDILTVPDDAIREARVLYTVVGGEVLYRREP